MLASKKKDADARHPNYGIGDPGHALEHLNIVAFDSEAGGAEFSLA